MFKNLGNKKLVLGLVHLLPMPSTPLYEEGNVEKMLDKALKDVTALKNGGADGCLLQAVDGIYDDKDDTDYARVATLSMIGARVRDLMGPDFKIGVQLMWNCITPSLAVAKACGADFTRCSVLVGESQGMIGTVKAETAKVMHYRNLIGAKGVSMISEIAGYHFKGTGDLGQIKDLTMRSMRAGANAIEIYNKDEELNETLVKTVKELGDVPVILGGGTDVENCKRRLKTANAALVGTCFEGGNWGGPVIESIVAEYCKNVRELERELG